MYSTHGIKLYIQVVHTLNSILGKVFHEGTFYLVPAVKQPREKEGEQQQHPSIFYVTFVLWQFERSPDWWTEEYCVLDVPFPKNMVGERETTDTLNTRAQRVSHVQGHEDLYLCCGAWIAMQNLLDKMILLLGIHLLVVFFKALLMTRGFIMMIWSSICATVLPLCCVDVYMMCAQVMCTSDVYK